MRKGITLPIVLIIFLFAFVPALLLYFYSQSPDKNVKGANSKKFNDTYGLSVQVTSNNGTWNMLEYLCKTLNECLTDLDSGKKLEDLSGGITPDHEVLISATDDWNNYEYLKIYVKPGWGSQQRNFSLKPNEQVSSTKIVTFGSTNAAIVPLEELRAGFVYNIEASD